MTAGAEGSVALGAVVGGYGGWVEEEGRLG